MSKGGPSTRSSANCSVETTCHKDSESEASSDGTTGEFAAIAKAVQKQLARNKASMMKELKEHSERTIQAAVKRAFDDQKDQADENEQPQPKKRKTREFKREGHRIRHEVNEDVLEKVEAAIKAIDKNDLEAAKLALDGGKKILNKQQKLICLADREENGWEVVKHYLSDDLASDSEDEKAINKARKEALASIQKRQSKKETFRNVPPRQSSRSSYHTYRRASPRYEDGRTRDPKSSECYRCGKFGHFQSSCPLRFSRT